MRSGRLRARLLVELRGGVAMSLETLTENGRVTSGYVRPPADPARNRPALAVEAIYRFRRLKLHALAFLVGVPVLGAVWVLTEYYEEHTWPDRFASAPDVAGTWDTWFFFVAGIWAIVLAVHAVRTFLGPPVGPIGRYIRRPIAQDELDRAVERLEKRG
jgi:hypothetical protein